MDNIVYFLGAGFSAPLDIPTMRNFIVKSKDMYFANTEKYPHFLSVFNTIEQLSVIKNYFTSDLFNIEEILSLLEMQGRLKGSPLAESFIKYIVDVIEFYTPEFKDSGRLPSNWNDVLFISGKWQSYGWFVASLFRLCFQMNRKMEKLESNLADSLTAYYRPHNYSVITLNYDLVLETVADFINRNFDNKVPIKFERENISGFQKGVVPIAKLHGSTDTLNIIPPTWGKNVAEKILPSWVSAFDLLSKANQIRIVGYSLPESDSYVKYLLKAAVQESKHLKAIDVICLDPDGTVRKRYDEFIDFSYYRYANGNVLDYLKLNSDAAHNFRGGQDVIIAGTLEESHEKFMSSHGIKTVERAI